jgi:putative DNA primase/helicase
MVTARYYRQLPCTPNSLGVDMSDNLSQFHDAMREYSLSPPDYIEPGKLYRFPGMDKRRGNTAGWCRLFSNCKAGSFGDWSTGLSEIWHANRDRPYTNAERTTYRKQVEQANVKSQIERDKIQADAAHRALILWMSSADAMYHPYLERKCIQPLGIRQRNRQLVIPMWDIEGNLCSCQTIGPDGKKMFLKDGRIKGCFYLIGGPIVEKVFICEGFATGASLHMHSHEIGAKGQSVVVAFNAKNLKPVTEAITRRYPQAEIIICADNDHETEGNPGLTEGRRAAATVGCKLFYPQFDNEAFTGTDFNDLINGGTL